MKCALHHVLALAMSAAVAFPMRGQAPRKDGRPPLFTDLTKQAGVTEAMARHYDAHPKWWLSGVNLVDLDGDGRLDLFLAAHGAGAPLALLGDGKGHFTVAAGSYPQTEIHLAHDIDEDGKLDLQMTFQDGGGKWWINESVPGRLSLRDSGIIAGQGRCNALIDLNRDGKVDWLHERPGVVYRNDSPARNWLRVRPIGAAGNRGAAGAKIRVTETGSHNLVWFEQVQILNSQSAHSYYSLAQTERHFGLAARSSVDVNVEFYPSGKRVEKKAVPVNTTVTLSEEAQQ